MSQSQKEKQDLFDAAVKLSAVLLAKGASEDDPQLALIRHTIMTACGAINDKGTAMLLQHHLNEFVDSVRILQKSTTLADVGLERALEYQN